VVDVHAAIDAARDEAASEGTSEKNKQNGATYALRKSICVVINARYTM
jgi:hypothetical protein